MGQNIRVLCGTDQAPESRWIEAIERWDVWWSAGADVMLAVRVEIEGRVCCEGLGDV